MTRRTSKGDVSWHLPRKNGVGYYERAFAYSTVAEMLAIKLLAEDGHTFESGLAALHFGMVERDILQRFIDEGYGQTKMSEFIK